MVISIFAAGQKINQDAWFNCHCFLWSHVIPMLRKQNIIIMTYNVQAVRVIYIIFLTLSSSLAESLQPKFSTPNSIALYDYIFYGYYLMTVTSTV